MWNYFTVQIHGSFVKRIGMKWPKALDLPGPDTWRLNIVTANSATGQTGAKKATTKCGPRMPYKSHIYNILMYPWVNP
jgi:hypothetical protein